MFALVALRFINKGFFGGKDTGDDGALAVF